MLYLQCSVTMFHYQHGWVLHFYGNCVLTVYVQYEDWKVGVSVWVKERKSKRGNRVERNVWNCPLWHIYKYLAVRSAGSRGNSSNILALWGSFNDAQEINGFGEKEALCDNCTGLLCVSVQKTKYRWSELWHYTVIRTWTLNSLLYCPWPHQRTSSNPISQGSYYISSVCGHLIF